MINRSIKFETITEYVLLEVFMMSVLQAKGIAGES